MLGFEWFMYLDPPQAAVQKGPQGQFIINQMADFCSAQVTLEDSPSYQVPDSNDQLSFCEFLCYFNYCKKKMVQSISMA